MCDAITRNRWLFGNKVARNFGSQFDVSCQTHRLLPVTVNLELSSAGINQLHALPLKLEWNINASKVFFQFAETLKLMKLLERELLLFVPFSE